MNRNIGHLIRQGMQAPTKKTPQQQHQERLDKAQDDRLAELELNSDRQDKRTRAVLRLSQFQNEFGARCASWLTAVQDIGSAYRTAYDTHKDWVSRQSNADALEIQIVFSVLTVMTAGGLSWLSRAAQAGENVVLATMARGVESAAQAAADKIYGTAGPVIYPANLSGGVNPHPQIFQNELEKKIYDVQQIAFKGFGQILQTWHAAPLHYWDDYRESHQLAVHNEWKNKADQLVGAEHLPSVPAMADELEIGLWAKYILEQHSHLEMPGVGWRLTDESYDYVGDVIYERLAQLHITTAAGLPKQIPQKVAKNQWEIGQALANAMTKLPKWAKEHKPRDFKSIKYPTRSR